MIILRAGMLAAAALAVALGSGNTQASTSRTITVNGVVDFVHDELALEGLPPLDASIQPGALFSASITFDPSAPDMPDTAPDSASYGQYFLPTDVILSGLVGNSPLVSQHLVLGIQDKVGIGTVDEVIFVGGQSPLSTVPLFELALLFAGDSSLLATDAIPDPAILPAFGGPNVFEIWSPSQNLDDPGGFRIEGMITSVSVIPEPTTVTIMILCGIFLAGRIGSP